jgi:hypothetical protein
VSALKVSLQNSNIDGAEMAKWVPIELDELRGRIAQSLIQMNPVDLRLWDLIRVEQIKWQLHPWGDQGGGFWVVGLFGMKVLWFNDIEDGFNISSYSIIGSIDDYFCNQDELHQSMKQVLLYLNDGVIPGRFGPPQEID